MIRSTDPYDPLAWLEKWPHDKQPLWDSWREVYTRFGLAAARSTEIETGLIMMIAQMRQVIERNPRIEKLLSALSDVNALSLGTLIKMFCKLYSVSRDDQLAKQLERARKSRNYLIHHFYRDRGDGFTTPEGCKELVGVLVSIYDELYTALEYLQEWRDRTFGYRPPEERWDEINEDVEKYLREEQLMLDAIGENARPDFLYRP